MRALCCAGLFAAFFWLGLPSMGMATMLRVSPVTLDLKAPAGASTVTLTNDDNRDITVQLRVFKWVQEGGEDRLVPTREVVASPPMIKLRSRGEQVVRVVRTAKSSPTAQESYRLLVDEVPAKSRASGSGVTFLVRHSVPLFFSPQRTERARVGWTARSDGRHFDLIARNRGANRLKVSSLLVKDNRGAVVARVEGLAGYVLAGSERRWRFDLPRGISVGGRSVTITAVDDAGPIRADATVRPGG